MLARILLPLLFLLSLASNATAAEPITVHHIPEGSVSSDGKTITYTLSQFEELVRLDLQLTSLQMELELANSLIGIQDQGLASCLQLSEDLEASGLNLRHTIQLKEIEIDYLQDAHKDRIKQVRRRGIAIGGATGVAVTSILFFLLSSR